MRYHRDEWLTKRLATSDVLHLFSTILISSNLGTRKPEPEIFNHLVSSTAKTIYVGDKQHNLDEAAKLGYDTVLADGEWHPQIEHWLAQ